MACALLGRVHVHTPCIAVYSHATVNGLVTIRNIEDLFKRC